MHADIKGVLLLSTNISRQDILTLYHSKIPCVVINPQRAIPQSIPAVTSNHTSGARIGLQHLLALGHRRIALLAGHKEDRITTEFLLGCHSALNDANIPANSVAIHHSKYTINDGYHITKRLLQTSTPPTAILALNDQMAFGTLRAAQELGVSIPTQLSVMGFADENLTQFLHPQLTSIQLPFTTIGQIGVEMLSQLIRGELLSTTRAELTPMLVTGDTTTACS